MLNGMINVYKESGYTSRDAVSRLSGILRQRKIGHTGTLDPAAEGVLPMCIGNATKLCEIITGERKEYQTVMKLGISTDTEDTTGVVIEESNLSDEWYQENITQEKVKEIVEKFLGKQEQIPPMYSAKRVDGKRLYELAREGKVIERKSCEITIYSISVEKIDLKNREISMTVECSKGTYIRTLCKDIGEKLGTKATMKRLLRTKTGNFSLEGSYQLDEIENLMKKGRVEEIIIPVEEVFSDLEKIKVEGYLSRLLENGGILPKDLLEEEIIPKLEQGKKFRMYTEQGEFKAVYYYSEKHRALKVYKMF